MDRERGTNTRRVAWYSVIRYVSDIVKGEILNVGLIMNIPEERILKFKLLSEGNSKLKSVLNSKVDVKTYKIGHDFLKYKMTSMVETNELFFEKDVNSKLFISQVSSVDLPKGFIFGETKFSKTAKPDELFNQLLREYIGDKFLSEESGSNSMVVRKKATKIINERILLKDKVKSNLKIKPIRELPKSYTIDFGYVENTSINLIQTAPDKLQTAYDWLERMNFLTENYKNADKILFLYNGKAESNKDGSMKQMLEYLSKKDDRILFDNIFTESGLLSFKNELIRIENIAKPVMEIETLAEKQRIPLIS